MNSLEEKLDDLFLNKLPPLPENIKENAGRFFPWVMIVMGVLGLLAWLSSIRLLFGFSGLLNYAPLGVFWAIYLIVAPVVQAMAIYGGYLMLDRQHKGWSIALYALLIGLIVHIFSFSIVGILLDFIFAYVLFQIKKYYTETSV
jgi:hypothetical protein